MRGVSCAQFRGLLERALADPRRRAEEGSVLSWHEHLLACTRCRELLAAEEALEELLASLPTPHLPADLAARVLVRLAAERGAPQGPAPLDRLLELDPKPVAPAGLARRVLANVAGPRAEGRLDELLEVVPQPAVPSELAARLLRRLAPARAAPRPALVRPRLLLPLAAAAVLAGVGLFWQALAPTTRLTNGLPDARVASLAQVEPELLASLDILENWELLMSEDLDLLFADLDPADEVLLELAGDPALQEER